MSEEAKQEFKIEPVVNTLKLGELVLESPEPIEKLIGLMLGILKNEEVQKYLEVLKKERITGGNSYTG